MKGKKVENVTGCIVFITVDISCILHIYTTYPKYSIAKYNMYYTCTLLFSYYKFIHITTTQMYYMMFIQRFTYKFDFVRS